MAVIRLLERPVRFWCVLWLVDGRPFAVMQAAAIGNHSGDLT